MTMQRRKTKSNGMFLHAWDNMLRCQKRKGKKVIIANECVHNVVCVWKLGADRNQQRMCVYGGTSGASSLCVCILGDNWAVGEKKG